VSGTVARETVPAGRASVKRETVPRRVTLPARILLLPLRAYRRWISPLLGARCRYYPSCSSYAEQAISELGAARGTILAGWRLLRCNPLSDGGFDHLEDRRLFRDAGGGRGHHDASGAPN
jgi:uncharacterized protein